MLKYLKSKSLFITIMVFYLLSLIGVIGVALYDKSLISMNMSEINEKDVDFFKVFFYNVLLITKIYFYGLLTFNIYSIFSLVQNVTTVGLICNSLIHNDKHVLALKLMPHGLFEFFGMAIAVSTVLWMWCKVITNFPKIVKREKDVQKIGKEVIVVGILTYVINMVIFLIAGIVEVIVSLYKVTG